MTVAQSHPRPQPPQPADTAGTRPVVVLAGVAAPSRDRLAGRLPAAEVVVLEPGELPAWPAGEAPAVLLLGDGMAPDGAAALLGGLPEGADTRVVVQAGSAEVLEEVQRTAGDRIFYGSSGPLAPEDLAALLDAALAPPPAGREVDLESDDGDLAAVLRVTQVLARAPSLRPALQALMGAVRDLLDADGSAILLHERDDDRLWGPPLRGEKGELQEVAGAGLTGFVLRTGRTLRHERAGDDPRHHPASDGPPDARFLGARVHDPRRDLAAVLVATRKPDQPPFGEAEEERLRRLAEEVAAPLSRLVLEDRVEQREAQRHGVFGSDARDMFRARAIERYVGGDSDRSDLLRIAPSWMRWTYRLLLLIFATGLLYVTFGTTREYAVGRGVVQADADGAHVSALVPGPFRPAVRPGMEMRFTLDGGTESRHLRLTRVGDEVVAPEEGLRRLGRPVGGTGTLAGPVFVVEAPLPAPRGDGSGYYPGMTGQVEVVVSSRRLLYRLLPSLEGIVERWFD